MVRVSLMILVAAAVFCFVAAIDDDKPCQGVHEAKYPCGKRCEPTCESGVPSHCKGLMCLGFSCRCQNGFVRNTKSDQCIRKQDCPVKQGY